MNTNSCHLDVVFNKQDEKIVSTTGKMVEQTIPLSDTNFRISKIIIIFFKAIFFPPGL
jgi:short subunit fatty acids transporter